MLKIALKKSNWGTNWGTIVYFPKSEKQKPCKHKGYKVSRCGGEGGI